jgi:anti-sigma B factor antagonist
MASHSPQSLRAPVATLSSVPGATHVIGLEGELDAFVAPELRERLRSAIEAAAPGVLVVDLARVTFLDSTILGALVGALRRMREAGGELKLVYPPHPASRIFELTGLDTLFPASEPTG